jgi:hypothetical protein
LALQGSHLPLQLGDGCQKGRRIHGGSSHVVAAPACPRNHPAHEGCSPDPGGSYPIL